MAGPPPPFPTAPAAGQAVIPAFLGSLATAVNWSYSRPIAYLTQTVVQSLGTPYNMGAQSFQNVVLDPYGGFKSATPTRWTPGVPGWYMAVGTVLGSAGPVYAQVRLATGGSTLSQVQPGLLTNVGATFATSGPGLLYIPDSLSFLELGAGSVANNALTSAAVLAAWFVHT